MSLKENNTKDYILVKQFFFFFLFMQSHEYISITESL